jgi:hypothetical protein
MAQPDRTDMLRVRMAPEETAMLGMLADDAAVTASDIFRLLIREAYRLRFGAKSPKGQV